MYIVAYIIVSVMNENIKIITIFNNETKINCIFKRLIDAVQLSVRQNIKIIMINVINKRARFFNVCDTVFKNIDIIIISISVFVVRRLNYELLLKRFFQRAARMNSININNKLFEMILSSLKEKKQTNFLKMLTEHINNKEKESVFAIESLNV